MESQETPVPPPRAVHRDDPVKKVKRLHDQAYHAIDEGITREGRGEKEQAFAKYQEGLKLIDDAVNIPLEGTTPEIEHAREMLLKMRRTRKEILSRVSDVQDSPQPPMPEAPPTYEEFLHMQSLEQDQANRPYGDLNAAMWEIVEAPLEVPPQPRDAEEIFGIPSDVQIFFVSPDGSVSAPSYPSALKIFKFNRPTSPDGSPLNPAPAFLQVGDWTYPLVPGRSPALHAKDNVYMFPDMQANVEGAAVGLILPPTTSPEVRKLFEDLLAQLTALRDQVTSATPSPSEYSRQMSSGIVKGAEKVRGGLVYGAEKAGEWLNYGTTKLMEKMQPQEQPKQVDPKVRKGVKVAKDVTGAAVQVSGFIVSRVGEATMALGRYIAPHLRKQGSKLISKATSGDERRASQQMDNVLEVAAGAVAGFGTVYMGLESAAKILARNMSNNTVQIVQHKYGTEVGAVANDTAHTVGYAVLAGHNISSLGVKGIAKRAAKNTGKALVEDYQQRKKTEDGSGETSVDSMPKEKKDSNQDPSTSKK